MDEKIKLLEQRVSIGDEAAAEELASLQNKVRPRINFEDLMINQLAKTADIIQAFRELAKQLEIPHLPSFHPSPFDMENDFAD